VDAISALRYFYLNQFDLKSAPQTDYLPLMNAEKQMEWETPSITEYGSVEKLTGTFGWFEDWLEEQFGGDAECEKIGPYTGRCTISYHGVS
jgi:hypothetical protein